MRKSMFTLMIAFLAFAVMTSCNPKVEVSESTEVEVAPEAPEAPEADTVVVAEPAVVEGVEASTDGTAVQ
jgi:hypothetical protein